MTATLKDMLKPEYVYTDVAVEPHDKDTAIRKIASMCAAGNAEEEKMLRDTFFAREEMDSTGCGEGVAIPHAKIKGLEEPKVEVLKFAQPLDWDAIDDKPVTLAIALVMPDGDKDNLHLQVISRLARKLVDEDFVAALEKQNTPEDLYGFLTDQLG